MSPFRRTVLERLLHGNPAPVQQVGAQLLELGARQRRLDVLGALGRRRDERQRDRRLRRRRQLHLGLLGGLGQALQRLAVLDEVDALVGLEVGGEPVDDALVEVVAAEVRVARGRQHLEDAVADLEHRHVKRAAPQVEDEDGLVGLLLEAVGERGGGGLVDDAEDLEAGDLAGVCFFFFFFFRGKKV